MTYFLTSSPCLPDSPALNPANGFVDELRRALPNPCRAVFIASSPDDAEKTDRFAGEIRAGFELTGFRFNRYQVLDRRNAGQCAALMTSADLLILAGGHVPTQNRFFRELGLRERLTGYDGVVMGISAGSMNAADVVYAQPEEPGEAIDPDYQKFLPGLGLTSLNIIPHYNQDKDWTLDGLRLYEDITYPDSVGRRFYAMVDGTYLLGRDGREELRGEAYLVADGALTQIGRENDITLL